MLRYVDVKEVFSEVPGEISLAINFSGCPIHCQNCHSPYLWEDTGIVMTISTLEALIERHKGITCVCFMGGDRSPMSINAFAKTVKKHNLKVAWYSGKNSLDENILLQLFDYIKLGPYSEEHGGLESPTTNQRMFKITDITYKFQNETNHQSAITQP